MAENPSSCKLVTQIVSHEKQHQQGQTITDLPEHILEEIFRRLRGEFLHSCLCVCRSFNKVILDTQSDRRIFRGQPLGFMLVGKEGSLNIRDFHGDTCNTTRIPCPFLIPGLEKLPVSNSCNGLVCYRTGYGVLGAVVCNPITGEYADLPTAGAEPGNLPCLLVEHVAYGLGYNPTSKQYNVLRMLYISPGSHDRAKYLNVVEDSVYTLGQKERAWRRIGSRKLGLVTMHSNGISLGNSVHWINGRDISTDRIVSFDFGTEEFGEIFPPSSIPFDRFGYISPWTLGALGDCLSLYESSCGRLEIWAMKEYGVQESWSKDFDIKLNELPHAMAALRFIPLQILKYGRPLLASGLHDLAFYNPVDKSVRCFGTFSPISVNRFRPYELSRRLTAHRPSLVSLKDIVNPDHLHVLDVHPRSVVLSFVLSSN